MLWIELFDSHLDNELPNFADMKYRLDDFGPQEQWQPDDASPADRGLDTRSRSRSSPPRRRSCSSSARGATM
jgi:hypothetical protein